MYFNEENKICIHCNVHTYYSSHSLAILILGFQPHFICILIKLKLNITSCGTGSSIKQLQCFNIRSTYFKVIAISKFIIMKTLPLRALYNFHHISAEMGFSGFILHTYIFFWYSYSVHVYVSNNLPSS